MEKIGRQTHPKSSYLIATSRILERASHFGLFSVILLYMINGAIKMQENEAVIIYGWMFLLLVFSHIAGALLADLLIGNKKAILIGAITQSIGAFSLCIPSISGLYLGILLIIIGGGFYTPSIISNYGKQYLSKIQLLDSGFTLLYFAENLGSFFGVLLIGFISEVYGWNFGFITVGILMLLSTVPILFTENILVKRNTENKSTLKKQILNISIAIVFVGLFWVIYGLGEHHTHELQFQLSKITWKEMPKSIWSTITGLILLSICVFFVIFWTYFYISQFMKLVFGFISGGLAFGVLLIIPEYPEEHHLTILVISMFLFAVSEIHIAPIIHSVLTQYSNPKYLATFISLSVIPTRLIFLIYVLFPHYIFEHVTISLIIGLCAMLILGFCAFLFLRLNKETL